MVDGKLFERTGKSKKLPNLGRGAFLMSFTPWSRLLLLLDLTLINIDPESGFLIVQLDQYWSPLIRIYYEITTRGSTCLHLVVENICFDKAAMLPHVPLVMCCQFYWCFDLALIFIEKGVHCSTTHFPGPRGKQFPQSDNNRNEYAWWTGGRALHGW